VLSFQIYFAIIGVQNLFCRSAKFILLECKIYFTFVPNLFCWNVQNLFCWSAKLSTHQDREGDEVGETLELRRDEGVILSV